MPLVDTFKSSKTELRTSISMFEHIDERGWAGFLMLFSLPTSQQDKQLWQGALQIEEERLILAVLFGHPKHACIHYVYCNILSYIRIT